MGTACSASWDTHIHTFEKYLWDVEGSQSSRSWYSTYTSCEASVHPGTRDNALRHFSSHDIFMSCSVTGGRPSRPRLLTLIWQHSGILTRVSTEHLSSDASHSHLGADQYKHFTAEQLCWCRMRILAKGHLSGSCCRISHFPQAHFPDSSWKV